MFYEKEKSSERQTDSTGYLSVPEENDSLDEGIKRQRPIQHAAFPSKYFILSIFFQSLDWKAPAVF